jgi:hypothetical protein
MCDFTYKTGKNKGQKCGAIKINTYDDVGETMNLCGGHRKVMLTTINRKAKNIQNLREFSGENFITNMHGSKGDRVNKSIFMCTLNTNKTLESMTDEYKERLKTLINYLFNMIDPDTGHENIYSFVLDCQSNMLSNDRIINRRHDYAVEIGDDQNRLHLHFTVEIDHNDCIRIGQELRQVIDRWLGDKVHFNIQVPKSPSSKIWERYVEKNVELLD